MKSITFVQVLALISIFAQTTKAQTLDIGEAVKKGMVSVGSQGIGGHSGECLKLDIKNKTKKLLKIHIPAGQLFNSADTLLQDLMVVKEETILVESGKTSSKSFYGFCIEAHNGSPGTGNAFTLGKLAEGALLKIAKHLSDNNLHLNPYAQFAVWAVTDGERLEGIGDPVLTKFVADLLGKPMPEYHIDYKPLQQDRLLPGQPANWREALAMNGLFYYDLASDQKVDFGLFNESGELVHALFKDRLQKRGQHKFKFEFEIKGLPKGKYFARLTNKDRVIKELTVEF